MRRPVGSVGRASLSPASTETSDSATDAGTNAGIARALSRPNGETPTVTGSLRITRQMHSAVRRTSGNGVLPILNVSGRTARQTRNGRAGMTSSPSGAVRTAYARARRRRKAPYRRSDVFARWDGRCCYCNAPAEHLDHVQPLSRGGRDVLSNVVPACADCNLAKAALTLAEWAQVTDSLSTHQTDPTEERAQ